MANSKCPEPLIQCPYDISHSILQSRFQTHLVKCKKNHPDSPLVECPFNHTHKVPEVELNCHKTYLCPDRNKLMNFIQSTVENKPLFKVENIPVNFANTENWDDEEYPTYDPSLHINDRPILMNIQGAKPSERKGFRAEQRLKHQQFEASYSSSSQTNAAPATQSALRRPTTISQAMPASQIGAGSNSNDRNVPEFSRGRGRGRILEKPN